MVIRAEEIIGAALVVAILGLVVVQVVGRHFLGTPYPGTVELARYGLIWLTFVGAAFVMARGQHIAVDVVSRPLGPRGLMVLDVVASLITIVTAAIILPASYSFVVAMNRVSSPVADIPMSMVYGAALVGFALMAVHCLVRLIIAVRLGPAGYADEDIGEKIASDVS